MINDITRQDALDLAARRRTDLQQSDFVPGARLQEAQELEHRERQGDGLGMVDAVLGTERAASLQAEEVNFGLESSLQWTQRKSCGW